jgi:hypothetical protein
VPEEPEATPAQITAVDFGHEGTGAVAFRTGDPFVARIHYRCGAGVDDVVCGIAVYRSGDLAHVFGQNTGQAEFRLAPADDGVVEFRVDRLMLMPGLYLVTVALHDPTGLKVYDWQERQYSFMVSENMAMGAGDGILQVEGRWRLAPAPVTS